MTNNITNGPSLSGVELPIGLSTIIWTADNGTESYDCDQQVTIVDLEAPSMICPDSVVVANTIDQCDAIANFSAKGLDNCDSSPVVVYSQDPGTLFPLGYTSVEAISTDIVGNSNSCFIVI